jgi:hypothetical protein
MEIIKINCKKNIKRGTGSLPICGQEVPATLQYEFEEEPNPYKVTI